MNLTQLNSMLWTRFYLVCPWTQEHETQKHFKNHTQDVDHLCLVYISMVCVVYKSVMVFMVYISMVWMFSPHLYKINGNFIHYTIKQRCAGLCTSMSLSVHEHYKVIYIWWNNPPYSATAPRLCCMHIIHIITSFQCAPLVWSDLMSATDAVFIQSHF